MVHHKSVEHFLHDRNRQRYCPTRSVWVRSSTLSGRTTYWVAHRGICIVSIHPGTPIIHVVGSENFKTLKFSFQPRAHIRDCAQSPNAVLCMHYIAYIHFKLEASATSSWASYSSCTDLAPLILVNHVQTLEVAIDFDLQDSNLAAPLHAQPQNP